jgi:hypothetical protein
MGARFAKQLDDLWVFYLQSQGKWLTGTGTPHPDRLHIYLRPHANEKLDPSAPHCGIELPLTAYPLFIGTDFFEYARIVHTWVERAGLDNSGLRYALGTANALHSAKNHDS